MARHDDESDIRATLLRLAGPELSPKEMLKLTRKAHPGASKKQIIHAAFGSLIAVAESDEVKARALQDFAIVQRGGED